MKSQSRGYLNLTTEEEKRVMDAQPFINDAFIDEGWISDEIFDQHNVPRYEKDKHHDQQPISNMRCHTLTHEGSRRRQEKIAKEKAEEEAKKQREKENKQIEKKEKAERKRKEAERKQIEKKEKAERKRRKKKEETERKQKQKEDQRKQSKQKRKGKHHQSREKQESPAKRRKLEEEVYSCAEPTCENVWSNKTTLKVNDPIFTKKIT
jgi:hypothetical protein